MSNVKTLINDLVIANRILANEDVVDAYGHVSVRHPDDPSKFLARAKPGQPNKSRVKDQRFIRALSKFSDRNPGFVIT